MRSSVVQKLQLPKQPAQWRRDGGRIGLGLHIVHNTDDGTNGRICHWKERGLQ
jgi:hypothetical protein